MNENKYGILGIALVIIILSISAFVILSDNEQIEHRISTQDCDDLLTIIRTHDGNVNYEIRGWIAKSCWDVEFQKKFDWDTAIPLPDSANITRSLDEK